jgi:hypothetical protein
MIDIWACTCQHGINNQLVALLLLCNAANSHLPWLECSCHRAMPPSTLSENAGKKINSSHRARK